MCDQWTVHGLPVSATQTKLNNLSHGHHWCKMPLNECKVLELIPVLDSQPADDRSHKPCGKLPLLSIRPVVTSQPLDGWYQIILLSDRGTYALRSAVVGFELVTC